MNIENLEELIFTLNEEQLEELKRKVEEFCPKLRNYK